MAASEGGLPLRAAVFITWTSAFDWPCLSWVPQVCEAPLGPRNSWPATLINSVKLSERKKEEFTRYYWWFCSLFTFDLDGITTWLSVSTIRVLLVTAWSGFQLALGFILIELDQLDVFDLSGDPGVTWALELAGFCLFCFRPTWKIKIICWMYSKW